jgi:hypothetical protein
LGEKAHWSVNAILAVNNTNSNVVNAYRRVDIEQAVESLSKNARTIWIML